MATTNAQHKLLKIKIMTIKKIQRLRKIHLAIRNRHTGNPKEFARHLHISERQLYNMIEYLKDTGALIKYSRKDETYYYENEFDILVNISVEVLLKDETYKIFGGKTYLIDNMII